MVIPIGGGGDPGLAATMQMRTVPPELEPRFRKIKICLVVLITSLLVKLIAAGIYAPHNMYNWIWNSLNPILNTIIGIFLLNDDRFFGKIYRCCLTTFCVSCQEQCPGGMSCLCTWFFCNMITAIFGLIPMQGSDINVLVGGFKKLNDPSTWEGGQTWLVAFSFFLGGTLFALLSQIVGAYQGWKAYSQATEMASDGPMLSGGGFGDPYGGNAYGGASGGGGGGAGGRYVSSGGRVEAASTGGSARGPTFTAFSGQGNRLGG